MGYIPVKKKINTNQQLEWYIYYICDGPLMTPFFYMVFFYKEIWQVVLCNGEKSRIPVCTLLRCYWRGRGIHYKSLIHNQAASQIGHNGNVWACGGCCHLSGNSLCHLCMYNIFKMFSSLANIQDWILDTIVHSLCIFLWSLMKTQVVFFNFMLHLSIMV